MGTIAAIWTGALAALLLGLSASIAAAQEPRVGRDARDQPTEPRLGPGPPPSGMQRFQIRHDTPAERAAFLRQRQAREDWPRPEKVQQLPAQRITPIEAQRQRDARPER